MFKATLTPRPFFPASKAREKRPGGIHQLRLPVVKFLEVQQHPAH